MTSTTRPTTDADRRELLAALRPAATRMSRMLIEMLSEDGTRISDHGRHRHTLDAFMRATQIAVHLGFIVERRAIGPYGLTHHFIEDRWELPYRDGVTALLEWAGGFDRAVADILASARTLDPATDLLAALALEPSFTVLLPPRPTRLLCEDGRTPPEWQSWFDAANAIVSVVTS